MNWSEFTDQLKAAVEANSRGKLTLGWRIRLWIAMQEAFGEEAQWRRDVLALLVVRELEPVTHEFQFPKDCPKENQRLGCELPPVAIANASLYLRGDLSFEEGARQLEEMADYSDNVIGYLKNGRWQGAYYGFVALLWRFLRADDEVYVHWELYDQALKDEGHLISEGTIGDSFVGYDVHYMAATVAFYTGDEDCDDLGEENVSLQRSFWHDWIDRQVPRVLGSVEDVRASLD